MHTTRRRSNKGPIAHISVSRCRQFGLMRIDRFLSRPWKCAVYLGGLAHAYRDGSAMSRRRSEWHLDVLASIWIGRRVNIFSSNRMVPLNSSCRRRHWIAGGLWSSGRCTSCSSTPLPLSGIREHGAGALHSKQHPGLVITSRCIAHDLVITDNDKTAYETRRRTSR